jgi:hypothetical protein
VYYICGEYVFRVKEGKPIPWLVNPDFPLNKKPVSDFTVTPPPDTKTPKMWPYGPESD